MAKDNVLHACRSCGYQTTKWMGKCPTCKEWDSFEQITELGRSKAKKGSGPKAIALHDVEMGGHGAIRVRTGLGELDRPLGGGLVAGSLTLIGGDPGVGKSTLLLMACNRLAAKGPPVLYASGEESAQQIRLRATRLGVDAENIFLLASTNWSHIEEACRELKPSVLIIDSVQTVSVPELTSLPGSVSQVRDVAHRAMTLAKGSTTAVMLVGHVTKSGDLAGPKVLEHFVDTVLYFEGDGRSSLRVLRSVKNRFGPAGELGFFEMVESGLKEVPDASKRLLAERRADAPGTAVIASHEGSRAMLAEVQALVGPSGPHTPARMCVGVERGRVQMLAAVLQKAGVPLQDRDLYVNAAGGIRLHEPAADLGMMAAIASSMLDRQVPEDTVWIGEIGLVGEIRAVPHPGLRLREAVRHGFRRVVGPGRMQSDVPPGLEFVPVSTVREALDLLRE